MGIINIHGTASVILAVCLSCSLTGCQAGGVPADVKDETYSTYYETNNVTEVNEWEPLYTEESSRMMAFGSYMDGSFTYLLYDKGSDEIQTYDLSMKASPKKARLLLNSDDSMAAVSFHNGERLGFRIISVEDKALLKEYSVFDDIMLQAELAQAGPDLSGDLSEQIRGWVSDRVLGISIHYMDKEGKSCYGTYEFHVDTGEAGDTVLNEETADNEALMREMGNVRLDDLTQTEITGWNSWEGVSFPLIAQLPEDDIYLYGFNGKEYMKGVVLRYKDKLQTFPWYYVARDTLPKIAFKDYDKDVEKELAVSLYNGSGTGISIEELHVLELEADGSFTDYEFTEGRYQKQFEQMVSFEDDGGGTFKLLLDGEAFTVEKTEEWGRVKALAFTNIVAFDLGNDIVIRVTPKIESYDSGPVYEGEITARVIYDNGRFRLADPAWKQN